MTELKNLTFKNEMSFKMCTFSSCFSEAVNNV